jgi:hypothetical protein
MIESVVTHVRKDHLQVESASRNRWRDQMSSTQRRRDRPSLSLLPSLDGRGTSETLQSSSLSLRAGGRVHDFFNILCDDDDPVETVVVRGNGNGRISLGVRTEVAEVV